MERHHFETELQNLKNRLLNMGALVEERVHMAIQALMERNLEAAETIAKSDEEVNALQIEIDDRCIKLFALQQPMASDLRLITSAMKINADLERIGDQAVNIAENAMKMLAAPPLKPIIDVPRMAEIAERMTRDSLDSFVKRDSALARQVLARDDEVDGLKDTIFRVLLTYRSEEHTSELQSLRHLVCRLLLEKKKIKTESVQIFVKIYPQVMARSRCN